MPDVFGMGEILVDKVCTAKGEEKWLAGGSVFNTMMDLYSMGVQVAFHSSLAHDDEGKFLLNFLADSGFPTRFFNTSEKSLYAMIKLDESGNPHFKIKNRDKLVLSFKKKHEDILKTANIFHTSAFSLNYANAREAILKAFRFARKEGIFCSFDLNMRSLEGDLKANELRGIITDLMLEADYSKPSHDDLKLLFPALKLQEIIVFLRKQARGNIVITNGDDPIIYIRDGRIKEITVKKALVVDATGAGDAFNAAVLASVLRGVPFSEAIESGCLLASMVVSHYGALASTEDISLWDRIS